MHFPQSGVKKYILLSFKSKNAFSWVWSQEMHFPESGVKRYILPSLESKDAFP